MFSAFIIFCTIACFSLFTILWFVCWIVARLWHYAVPFAPFGYFGLAIILFFYGAMLYGYWFGRFQLHVQPTTYASSAVPDSFNGYKIVHISDLHLSTFASSPDALQRVIDTVNKQQPDLICFTGDFVSFGVEEAIPFTSILRQLHAKDGVISVLGNHDFALYHHQLTDDEKDKKVEQLTQYQRDTLGWKLLRNQSYLVARDSSTMQIIGVDNASCQGQGFQTVYRANLPIAISTSYTANSPLPTSVDFQILLSHDPSHWRAEVLYNTNIPLTLSGHTHAGQVRIFGYPLSSLMFKESQGWYETNDQSLYVNTGIGCTLPVRIAVPAEITIITLQSK